MGVIIGRKARRLGRGEVREHIAGVTVMNEVSARDIQLAEHEKNPFFRVHHIGKSFDTFCPAGPALVTVDEFAWGKPLKMSTRSISQVAISELARRPTRACYPRKSGPGLRI